MFRIFAGAMSITAAAIAASFAIVSAQPAAAAVTHPRPQHAVSCQAQLRAVNAAERGETGARGLAAAGLPELAATARAAGTLAGARWYGVALEATSAALGNCGHGQQLPAWLHEGSTSDRDGGAACIVVWGGTGSTSAEICADGTAYTS